jgi:hypothetical protein
MVPCCWLYYNRLLSELNLARERGIMLRQVENPRFYEKAIERIRSDRGSYQRSRRGRATARRRGSSWDGPN